jgi:hypothetical protein
VAGDPENSEGTNFDLTNLASDVSLIGFALTECVVKLDAAAARYLRAVHRTALELAVPDRFGFEAGGFWLTQEQIAQLRRLPDYYPPHEAEAVTRTVEAYLKAQLQEFYYATTESREAPDH